MKKELKQVMHNAIAQHSPTDAKPVPEQWSQASFLPILYTKTDSILCGISLWPVSIGCSDCVSSQLLMSSSLLPGRVIKQPEKSLTQYKHCLETARICVFSYKIQNTAHHQPLGRNLTLSQTKPGREARMTLGNLKLYVCSICLIFIYAF